MREADIHPDYVELSRCGSEGGVEQGLFRHKAGMIRTEGDELVKAGNRHISD